jgi:WD40 repeat protein
MLLGLLSGAAGVADQAKPANPPRARNRPELVVQRGHGGPGTFVAFSPDSRLVLTAGFWDMSAILWDVETGKELRRFQHTERVWGVAFSPDGQRILTGSGDHTAVLWDAKTGEKIRSFAHADSVGSVAFAPDGLSIASESGGSVVRIWDIATGKVTRSFEDIRGNSFAFSPDGRLLLTASPDKTARLWDVHSGKEVRRFNGHTDQVDSVALAADGNFVVTGSQDSTVRLWDAATGREIHRIPDYASYHTDAVAISPDGRAVLGAVLTKDGKLAVRMWDTATGKELRLFLGYTVPPGSLKFSPNGKMILSASEGDGARIWDATTGKVIRRLDRRTEMVRSVAFGPDMSLLIRCRTNRAPEDRPWLKDILEDRMWLWSSAGRGGRQFKLPADNYFGHVTAFSPDGRMVLTGNGDAEARLWETATSKEIRRFRGHQERDKVTAVAFAPDGRSILTGSSDKTARVWETATGKELQRFKGHGEEIFAVVFSSDGRRVLTGSRDKTARLWETATGNEVRRFVGHTALIWAVALSPDGRLAATGSQDGTARLWETATGKQTLLPHGNDVESIAFSPDGNSLLTGCFDTIARLWDVRTGKLIRRFTGHSNSVESAAFSPDGRFVLTGSSDSTARLWQTATGRELCRLVSFDDGSWAVIDAEGRFDASNGGDVQGLHWVVGYETIDLAQLKDRYFDPGLLQKKLGIRQEPLRDVGTIVDPKLYPEVHLAAPAAGGYKVGITLNNRGGGIGRVIVKINGKELTADARGPGVDQEAKELHLELDLSGDPRLKPGEKNIIEVQAFNAEGYLRSRGLQLIYEPAGQSAKEPPELWAVVAGVSQYQGEAINLRYAAKDAEDFAKAIELAGSSFFLGAEHVYLTVLTSSQTDPRRQPTRTNLVQALEALQKAKPGDVLVIYLSGHGVNYGGPEGDFYYLTADAQNANLADPEIRKQVALSSRELTELIKKVPAEKQVLVLDTCAAARAVDKLTDKRDVPSSQVRALERVKDRTGLHILAGCAADAVSYEASRYAQGILTYSLLMGMRGAALDNEEYVDVRKLFDFSADWVPELARDIGGIQRPVVASPRGASFVIGRVTAQDQQKIPLQPVRPLVLRTTFQDEEEFTDVLGIGKQIDDLLRDASARGRNARLVFVEAREMADAYQLAGRYKTEGDKVTVIVRLARGKEKAVRFTATGSKAKVEELAATIVREMQKRLGSKEQ